MPHHDASDRSTLSRRTLLRRAGCGLGLLALGDLLRLDAAEAAPGALGRPHHPPRADAVIWLHMHGGPSAIDTFDPKPALEKLHGQRMAQKIETFGGSAGPYMKSPFTFARHGQCGAWVSELYPGVAKHVDRLAILRSCVAESNSHAPAMYHINTGMPRAGFPSVGAWVTYGLGTANRDLPGYIVLGPKEGPKGGPENWGAGFLPGAHQATLVRDLAEPILHLHGPVGEDPARARARQELLGRLNDAHRRARPGEDALDARVAAFELAWRMQTEAPAAFDIRGEDSATRALYGLDRRGATASFAAKCLLARRLVERGVRFVQVYTDADWDAHGNLVGNHKARCAETDVPIAGLLADLSQRGLLARTLVVWGGEFGRLPISEQGSGRDHNPHGFTMWLAGGGVKGGVVHGATDETGLRAVEHPVSIHDLHATILHLLGIDHERLTWLHNGRRFRLTDIAGEVVRPILV